MQTANQKRGGAVTARGLLTRARELFRRKPKADQDKPQDAESESSSGGLVDSIQAARQAVRDASPALAAALAALDSARKANDMVPERVAAACEALSPLEEASSSLARACSEAIPTNASDALEGPVLRAWAFGKAEVTDALQKLAQARQDIEAAEAAPAKLPTPGAGEDAAAAPASATPAGQQTAADTIAKKLEQREAAAAEARVQAPPALVGDAVAAADDGPDFSAFLFLFFVFAPIFGLVAFVSKDI